MRAQTKLVQKKTLSKVWISCQLDISPHLGRSRSTTSIFIPLLCNIVQTASWPACWSLQPRLFELWNSLRVFKTPISNHFNNLFHNLVPRRVRPWNEENNNPAKTPDKIWQNQAWWDRHTAKPLQQNVQQQGSNVVATVPQYEVSKRTIKWWQWRDVHGLSRTHRKYFQKNLWETETTQQVGWNPPSASILRRKTQVIWTVYYSHRPLGFHTVVS